MAKAVIHDAVKNALIKSGWEITADQYLVWQEKLPLLVVNTATEEILKWIN